MRIGAGGTLRFPPHLNARQGLNAKPEGDSGSPTVPPRASVSGLRKHVSQGPGMPVGNITGLSSGIEWAETVKLLMQVERRPLETLQERRSTYSNQLTNWNSIESKLKTLRATAEGIDTPNELLIKSASSSDNTILTATASASAIAGTHSVLIDQVATSHILVHSTGWADANSTPVNDSGDDQTFSYQFGATAVSVSVPDGTTLTQLVNLINNDPDNPGVRASILNDGSGGATAYHLVLTGEDTGEDNTISILDTGGNPTDLGDGDDFDASEWDSTQTAQNARLRVDGFPDPGWGWPVPWIESASNTVENILPGVTLNLKSDSAGEAIALVIALDKASVKDKVNNLIRDFNDVITTVTNLTAYNAETKVAGPLAGDSLARSLKQQLTALVAANIPGTTEDDTYRSLGQIGISIGTGGRLALDAKKFEAALDADATAVARLLAFDATSSSGFVSVAGNNYATQGGEYAFTISYDADGKIDSGGTNAIGGEDGNIHGNSLLAGKTGSAVEGLLLLLTNPGDGPSSISGTVRVYKGLSSLLAEKIEGLTDDLDGRLKYNRDRINDTIKSLDSRIESWEARLKRIEENYNRRFQVMESLVGQLRSQSNYLNAALSG
ncbi:MAG: hypothetical protein FJY67_02740 [Calditrichaeota bacterium]|nr:hypothetical protein [Calditrichota bacterium]